nr:MAG TPA: hypothetical protein [Caudoviricetes sp.]
MSFVANNVSFVWYNVILLLVLHRNKVTIPLQLPQR